MSERQPLLEARKVKKIFRVNRKQELKALDDVSFVINKGDKFAVVGESGCGKSTLGKVVLQLYEESSGSIIYYGKSIDDLNPNYIVKEINKLSKYQKTANDYYQESLKIDDNIKELKVQQEGYDSEGSKTEVKKYNELDKNINELEYKSKEARKNSSRQLREGAKICGSLILVKEIEEVKRLYLKASEEVERAFKLRQALYKNKETLVSATDDKKINKIKDENQDLIKKIQECQNNRQEYLLEADNYKGKNILPINERAQFTRYQDRLDRHRIYGINLTKLNKKEMRQQRRDMQMIFQDPAASLDPRMTIGEAVEEAFIIHTDYDKNARKKLVLELLRQVGLKEEYYYSYPNTLSGGQKQRVGIAKALALKPSFMVLDESVSALDVSVQAQILTLLNELHDQYDLTYFFITHDLGVVKHFCDRIMVMYLGNNFEYGSSEKIFKNPLHPYTQSLLASVPRLRPIGEEINEQIIEGEVPSPINVPSGCPFHTRCTKCIDVCKKVKPKLINFENEHMVACHLYKEGNTYEF
jgi:peptide/nickel transport system ATP-binding protein